MRIWIVVALVWVSTACKGDHEPPPRPRVEPAHDAQRAFEPDPASRIDAVVALLRARCGPDLRVEAAAGSGHWSCTRWHRRPVVDWTGYIGYVELEGHGRIINVVSSAYLDYEGNGRASECEELDKDVGPYARAWLGEETAARVVEVVRAGIGTTEIEDARGAKLIVDVNRDDAGCSAEVRRKGVPR